MAHCYRIGVYVEGTGMCIEIKLNRYLNDVLIIYIELFLVIHECMYTCVHKGSNSRRNLSGSNHFNCLSDVHVC